ncbi:acyl-CoA dehydrogenase family protein [Rothia kristinae]|uniref:acyl-CoA dehydrogenase family protein n=1 Tax=Rothia kristinae TaxID=37923 RepID=UPI0011A7D003|nr:acyl-CoA dehydrogenase family protein [Rothia kristinae]
MDIHEEPGADQPTLPQQPPGCGDWTARVEAVARVAAQHAADVDAVSRFPDEAIEEARRQGLLGAPVLTADGGLGATHRQLCEAGTAIARECASTAMILMMHYSQLLCLTRHAGTTALQQMRRQVAGEQLLIASATTEAGIGGNTRASSCFLEPQGPGRKKVHKVCPVISYGRFADIILVTTRASADAAESDQRLAAVPKSSCTLLRTRGWDTLGMRGTMSEAFELDAEIPEELVFPEDFATLSALTMLPASHTLWASAWYGMAAAAGDTARRTAQKAARRTPGTPPPQALRVAELEVDLQRMHDSATSGILRFEEAWEDFEALTAMSFAIGMDTLKVSCARLVRQICADALQIVGIAGYSNASPVSLARSVRDAHGPSLMVSDDRLLHTVGQLQMVSRGTR